MIAYLKTKHQNNKKIINNFLSLSSLQLINYIFPLITFPYIISIIGIEKFGLLALATATVNYFGPIIDFGFNISATRDISKFRHNTKILSFIFSKILLIKIYLFLISFIVFTLLVYNINIFYEYKEVYFITFFVLLGTTLMPLWFFMGVEDMKYLAIFNFVSKLLFLCLLFILVQKQEDYWIIPLLLGIGNIIVAIISLKLIKDKYRLNFLYIPINKLIKEIFQKYHIFIVHYVPILYGNIIYTFLGVFTNNTTIGLFAIAEKIMMIGNSFIYMISSSFYPSIVKNLSKLEGLKVIILTSGFILSIATYFFSNTISNFLVNDFSSVNSIKIISISFIFTSIYALYGLTYLVSVKQDKLLKRINIYISSLGVIYSYFLIDNFILNGAIFSILISRFLFAITSYFYFKRISNGKNNNIFTE